MIDSDSEGDVFTNTNGGFNFQNDTTVSARGPNTNASNLTGVISFRGNVISSTMQMPRTFERQRYAESNYDQRSMYYERRRETSPMSIMSACDVRQRNFNKSYYPQAMSSQRSVFNGRRSPMSVRSIDSSASVSAADIVMAFKSVNFNKHELRVIKEAYNKLMRHKVRKKIEKRRNLKHFLKGCRRISGGDSGEQGSDSSLSSDDRSTRTSHYKDNLSSCRSTKTDFTNFRRTIKESNMYKDCTENFKNDSFRSLISGQENPNAQSCGSSRKSMFAGSSMSSKSIPLPAKINNHHKQPSVCTVTQKERFQNGFLLPSQRFNRSVAAMSIPEITENINHDNHLQIRNMNERNKANNFQNDSDQEENIFSGPTKQQNTNAQRKRSIESDEDIISLPNQKRTKIISPCKNSKELKTIPKETSMPTKNNDRSNDFVFAKPAFPVRKSTKEKLLAKCNAPLLDSAVQESDIPQYNKHLQAESHAQENDEDDQTNITQSTTDLSSRPSFIKRKLFTQKLDIAEKRNTSTDSSSSPQNSVYGAIQKEKHKARKLQQVMTQSCLSRDIQDDNNLLDLIHKIVPREQMNVTSHTNKTDLQSKSKNKSNDSEKWDVTSIILDKNNEEDVSDTYTDEEIFNATVKELAKEATKECNKGQKKGSTPKKSPKECIKENGRIQAREKAPNKQSPLKKKSCTVLVQKLTLPVNCISDEETNDGVIKSVRKRGNFFWDTTDVESDAECQPAPRKNANYKETETIVPGFQQPNKDVPIFQGVGNKFSLNKLTTVSTNSTFLSNTTDIIQKFDTTTLRIKSHRNPIRKNLDRTQTDDNAKSAVFEPQSKKQKPVKANSRIEINNTDLKNKEDLQNQICNNKDSVTGLPKPDNKKNTKVKTPTKTVKTKKTKQSAKNTTLKKQIGKINKQAKTSENENQLTNNNEEDVQSKDEIKKGINKQKKGNRKSNESKVDKILIEENIKATTKKTTSNKKQLNNDKTPVDNEQQPRDIKAKVSPCAKTKKQSKTTKKPTETKPQIKKCLKTRNKKDSSLRDESINDSLDKENNNTSCNRTLRSCRLVKQNSNTTLDETIQRTLRPRQNDSNTTIHSNVTKSKQKVDTAKESRLSEVSFSLQKKKTLPKRAVNSRKNHDIESSDVSFSITARTPKKATAHLNSRGKKLSVTLNNTMQSNNSLESRASKSLRKRLPNKRYMNTSEYF